ncbi:MAG: rhomboid family intramembrane serine protease [Gammaproteobacteria bacterium]|nr:rhomboid family intramembrane serine protease [Gammaproteobacteria bacterium]MCK5092812.1 rhomboid family intramembrane serine protease [Gammaproteobacteria bacterium]
MFPLHDDNPTETIPYVTIALIAICTLVFFWQLSLGSYAQQAVVSLGFIPATLFDGKSLPTNLEIIPAWMTIFTSMFMHGGWMHIIGNMLYLWIFGNNVEDSMGHARFIGFYLLCGIIAVAAHSLPDPASTTPLIGASGALAGVLGAYLLLYPHAKVLVAIPFGFFIHTMRLPAGLVLGFWFILQIFNSASAGDQAGGIAWGAHIGGFIAGMALIPVFKYKKVKLFSSEIR